MFSGGGGARSNRRRSRRLRIAIGAGASASIRSKCGTDFETIPSGARLQVQQGEAGGDSADTPDSVRKQSFRFSVADGSFIMSFGILPGTGICPKTRDQNLGKVTCSAKTERRVPVSIQTGRTLITTAAWQ